MCVWGRDSCCCLPLPMPKTRTEEKFEAALGCCFLDESMTYHLSPDDHEHDEDDDDDDDFHCPPPHCSLSGQRPQFVDTHSRT